MVSQARSVHTGSAKVSSWIFLGCSSSEERDMDLAMTLVRRTFACALLSLRGVAGALIVAPLLALVASPAGAERLDNLLDRLGGGMFGLQACASSAAGATEPEDAFSGVAACATDRVLSDLLGETVALTEEQGQVLFGENFRIVNRLGFSAFGHGMRGDVDAVLPLNALSSVTAEGDIERALFVQSGLTRWTDGQGFRRNDVRHGLVYRFVASDGPGDGIFGTWSFVQHNLERGHERLVAGVDYAGEWGSGALNYFHPLTDWLPGRPGHEERAIAGVEFDLRLDATDTIALNAAVGRWEALDGSGDWMTRTRLGLEWRPHSWLSFGSDWGTTGAGHEDIGARMAVIIPLGGGSRALPRWRGLGLAGGGSIPDASDVWRPIETVGPIEVAERTVPILNTSPTEEATVRFLQDSVDTGGTVQVEVALSSPASKETRLAVRLVPGAGDNPAVPGEDYVDETMEIVIPQGESSAVASFRLLHNPSLQSARSLSVTVTARA